MSDNAALVLILCTVFVSISVTLVVLVRGAVEVVRIVKGRDVDPRGRL